MKKLLLILTLAVCASNTFAYYQAQEGRWLSRDPIGESGGKNIYGFVDNNAQNYVDEFGLLSSSYFKESCSLVVIMTWRVKFKRGMNKGQKDAWLSSAKTQIESYFSQQSYKCFPTNKKCCECKSGVSVMFNLIIVPAFWSRDYTVSVDPDYFHSSSVNPLFRTADFDLGDVAPQYKGHGATQLQVPILHETGHMLGLDHPGGNSNEAWAYEADIDATMGGGNTFRAKSFTKAFCSRIKGGKECKKWEAK